MTTIVRLDDEARLPFTMVPNVVARDCRISLRAAGLLLHLLSFPPGWNTSVASIAACRREGKHAVGRAMQELKAAGYVVQHRQHNPKTGRFEWFLGVRIPYEVLTDDPPTLDGESGGQADGGTAATGRGPVPTPRSSRGRRSRSSTDSRALEGAFPQVRPIDRFSGDGTMTRFTMHGESGHITKTDKNKDLPLPPASQPESPPTVDPTLKGREGKGEGGSKTRARRRLSPPRSEPAPEIVSKLIAAAPARHRGTLKASRRSWWPAVQAALDAGWTLTDLAAILVTPWPSDCRSPAGLVASRLYQAAQEGPPADVSPAPRAVPHCGQCSPVRRLEDEDGNDLGPCPRCNPAYWAVAAAAEGVTA